MADDGPRLAAPANFQRIGWHGLYLSIPSQWNLRLFAGNARQGALVFADLSATRLECRWRSSPRSPAHTLENARKALQKRRPQAIQSPSINNAIQFQHQGGITLIAAIGPRLCELHWPASADTPLVNRIAHDFLQTNSAASATSPRFWSIYGASGWVPASARLQKASLLPGAARLAFRIGFAQTTTLGSVSLADRLLQQSGSLGQWALAAFPLIARNPAGQWQESESSAIFTAPTRRFFAARRHRLILEHDPAANRILWTHHFDRPCD